MSKINIKNKISAIVVVCLIIIVSTISVFADAKHVFTGGYSSTVVKSLKFVMSGGDSTYQSEIMNKGAQSWNGISSQVNVAFKTSGANMSIYKSTTTEKGLFGELKPFKSVLGVLVNASITDVWYVTDVMLYDNQMTTYGFTLQNKRATCAHEVGHGLSLAHTNDLSTVEIMDQGIGKSLIPTSVDKGHLKLKWGM